MKPLIHNVPSIKGTIKFVLLCVLLITTAHSQTSDWTIRNLQDRRVEHSNELFSFLKSTSWKERELALLAIANIQDTSAVEVVIPLLNDPVSKVRSMAAFALGMVQMPNGTNYLFRRLSLEREEKVIAEIFNAIGLSGDQEDLKKMIIQTDHYSKKWNTFIVQSIMRFANRKIIDVSATKYVASHLDESDNIINTVYAFMRINDSTMIRNNRERLFAFLSNRSPLVRMWTATMLGSIDDSVTIKNLVKVIKMDKDWRVRVNAVRSLRFRPTAKNEMLKIFSDKNEHVGLSAIAAYDQMTLNDSTFEDKDKIVAMMQKRQLTSSVTEELRILIAKRTGDWAFSLIGQWESDQQYVSAQRLRAYGETRSEKAIPILKKAIQESTNSTVVISGLESYQRIAQNADDIIKKDFLKTAILMFQRNDAGISYTATQAFLDTSFSKEIRRIYLSALYSSYAQMNTVRDLEPLIEMLNIFGAIGDSSSLPIFYNQLSDQNLGIRTAAEQAFRAITGEDSPIRFIRNPDEYSPFFSQSEYLLLKKYKGVDIRTNKGNIRIIFDKDAAPLTVLNFILLTEKKFYDGLSFHRVVGNFVIQGGDPLGNGSGGPNYAIRTEVHPNAKYRTGAVGMASAGKDTEGSQWFITHCPTPHLDYRYSIFGYTRDGATVNKIMVGDRIESTVLF